MKGEVGYFSLKIDKEGVLGGSLENTKLDKIIGGKKKPGFNQFCCELWLAQFLNASEGRKNIFWSPMEDIQRFHPPVTQAVGAVQTQFLGKLLLWA